MALAPSERFLGWMTVEQGRSIHTVDAYRRDLRDYESWLGKRRRTALTATSGDVEAYVQSLRGRGLAATTVARRFAAIRMYHRWMLDESERRDDPCALVDGVKVPAGLPKALSEDAVGQPGDVLVLEGAEEQVLVASAVLHLGERHLVHQARTPTPARRSTRYRLAGSS